MAKRKKDIRVYCSEEEAQAIMEQAIRTGLSVSSYMRRVSLGYFIKSREDAQAHRNLLKVNADQARLSNLLKMAISNGQQKEMSRLSVEILETQKILKQAALAIHNGNDK